MLLRLSLGDLISTKFVVSQCKRGQISIFQAHRQGKRMYLLAPKNYLGSACHAHYTKGGWKNQFKNALI